MDGASSSDDALRDPPRDSFAESSLPHDATAAAAGVRCFVPPPREEEEDTALTFGSTRPRGDGAHLLDGHAAGDGDALPSFPPPFAALRPASIASSSAVTPRSPSRSLEPREPLP